MTFFDKMAPESLKWSLLFLLGLGVGSFINCLVYRLNHGLSPLVGRSFCPKCKHQLAWYDNIPLVSFVLLKGKCRYCHSPISWQYPLVELATGILTYQVSGIRYHGADSDLLFTIYYLLITYTLIALFVSDLIYQTIPDKIVYPAIALVVMFHLRDVPRIGLDHLGGVLLSGLGAAGLFLFLVLITKGRGMGMGDIKLVGLMGLFLGWPKIVVALYLAFLTGAILGVILILLGKKRFGEQIPFGPFLTGATILSLFQGDLIWAKILEAIL